MEAYSNPMHAAVLREVQQSSTLRLVELANYYRRRQGPGFALVIAELRDRRARRQSNYPPSQAA